jgi:ADP-ribose pyrophosphatase YjhB (NUDIX family)
MKERARHCLACGSRLTTVREEGRRRRRCPRCGWTFYDNPTPAAVAIIQGRGGILLARRAAPPYQGTWDLPGGFLERGELPDRALDRELREELGTRAAITRFHSFSTERYGRDGFPILAVVYVVHLAGEPTAGSDVAEVRWFHRDAIPWRRIGFPSVRRALREYLRSEEASAAGAELPTDRARRGREQP